MITYEPNWVDIGTFIVSMVTCLTIGFAALQLIFHSRQTHREFESLYVQRYWNLMDKRSEPFAVKQKVLPEDKSVIRGYLQLCEDEIDLRRLGRVTDHTWRFWASAIKSQCSEPAYKAELKKLDREQYPRVRELLAYGSARDPLDKHWVVRKLHGL